jgi:hypothetical protein
VQPWDAASAAMTGAWASVGNPGYGAVRIVGTPLSGIPFPRSSSTYFSLLSTRQPAWWNTDRTVAKCRQSTPRKRTLPPAAAAADNRVAATMRSPIMRNVPPESGLPPSTMMVELPAPRTLAPRLLRKL